MLGPDLLLVVFVLAVWLVIPLWAIADALSRPAFAFSVAGWNKTAWVLVLLAATVFGVGSLLGGFYLLAVRRKLRLQPQLAVSGRVSPRPPAR